MYLFPQTVVIDPITGTLVKGAEGRVYAEDDTAFTTPLEVERLDGLRVTTVRVGLVGLTEAFRAPAPLLIWKAGDIAVPVTSYQALFQLSEETREIARDAVSLAQAAQILAGSNNRVWPPSYTPPDGAKVGDLWIDESANRALKRWNGSIWELVQDFDGVAQAQLDEIREELADAAGAVKDFTDVKLPVLNDRLDQAKLEVEAAMADAKKALDSAVLRIDSSRGTAFKNNEISTVLTVTVIRGGTPITDIVSLREAYGAGAYLEWSWRRLNDADFGTLSALDPRISRAGFALTVSPTDVDTKVVFMCSLNT